MLIIPAIDLKEGKCVRLTQGRLEEEIVFSENPVEVAKIFENKGAKIIHIVDLEGAIFGSPKNLDVVKKIRSNVDVILQFGGGIRSIDILDEILKLRIDRCILGTTILLEHEKLVKEICQEFGEKIIVGIDAKEGKVAIKGWTEITKVSAFRLAQEVEKLGAKRIIYTDIQRDGMLIGPNIKSILDIVESVKIPVIASGGISSYDDIEKLKKLKLEGMIIGKAIYKGDVNLQQAIKVAEN